MSQVLLRRVRLKLGLLGDGNVSNVSLVVIRWQSFVSFPANGVDGS